MDFEPIDNFSDEETFTNNYDLYDLFIQDCVYDLIEYISDFKEQIPYISNLKVSQIIYNILEFALSKTVHKKIINYNIEKDLIIFFIDNVNQIINYNKKIYNINDTIYKITQEEIAYLLN